MRRFFRIVPIYYISILAYFAVTAVAGSFLTTLSSLFTLFILAELLVFHYPPIALGWFGPTWSLAVEEQFYLIAPLTMQLLSRRVPYVMLGATVCLAPLLRTWVHYNLHALGSLHLILGYTITPCRADAPAIGICAALLWRNTTFRQKLAYHGVLLYLSRGVLLTRVLILESGPLTQIHFRCIPSAIHGWPCSTV
jgi:peptidoglycan/LPS O-acetylase OafA/YrhL